jgi:hypothetical protein
MEPYNSQQRLLMKVQIRTPPATALEWKRKFKILATSVSECYSTSMNNTLCFEKEN